MAKISSNFNLNNQFNYNNLNNNNNTNDNSILKQNASVEESMVNIANYEAFTICQRCKQKESVFSCLICESFKFLCTKCDNYLHSLPSKQAHQRLALIPNIKKSENVNKDDSRILNKIEENNYSTSNNNLNNLNTNSSFDLNYKFNLSPINRLNNLGREKDMSGVEYNSLLNKNNNNANLNNRGDNNNNNLISYGSVDNSLANLNGISNMNNAGGNKNNFMNIQEGGNGNPNSGGVFNNFKIPNAQSFSREYVYEIKVD